MKKVLLSFTLICLVLFYMMACFQTKKDTVLLDVSKDAPEMLSAFNFFKGELKKLQPNKDVFPYDLNSTLFTDYAFKARFFYVPTGGKVAYQEKEALDLPVGSCYIKNFYYPADFSKPEGERRIIETRILIHRKEGWEALPYVWNEAQTDAALAVAGDIKEVTWKHYDGTTKNISYLVPNKNQCKSCHWNNTTIKPIGPTAKNLNRTLKFEDGEFNQLEKWKSLGYLQGLPQAANIPQMANYNDTTLSLDTRARAYLDINCAHCHRENGAAYTSGLHLGWEMKDLEHLGVCKSPVAAGIGTGGLMIDIVPGAPEKSILAYRMASTEAGIKMPELGRVLAHKEGVELINKWILSMKGKCN